MSELERIKTAIKDQYQKDLPLMDVERMREVLLEWLQEVKLPASDDIRHWDECIRVFPPKEGEEELESGTRMRVVLRMYTKENRYLISALESLDPKDRGIYILCAHVNWKGNEKAMQKTVDQGYKGYVEDGLKPKHTLWIQTVRWDDIHPALDRCAVAILANELVPNMPDQLERTLITNVRQQSFNIPTGDEKQ